MYNLAILNYNISSVELYYFEDILDSEAVEKFISEELNMNLDVVEWMSVSQGSIQVNFNN